MAWNEPGGDRNKDKDPWNDGRGGGQGPDGCFLARPEINLGRVFGGGDDDNGGGGAVAAAMVGRRSA